MNLVFISNIEFSKPAIAGHDYSHIATIASSIDSICASLKQIKKDDTTVFIIDAHCTIKRSENMQDQGGVIIYRQLLNLFKDHQEQLKVVFYSPVSKDDLVKHRAENYILKLLPFINCNYDEKFTTDLSNILKTNSFPKFNNASENLLSGWSINDENKVEVKKKEIVFVDDQAEEWRNTFEKVFKLGKGGAAVPEIFPYNKKSNEDRVFSLDKLDESFAEKVRASDLLISDFYLEENHELNNWMSAEELSKKSGFQLFQAIKGTKDTKGIHKGVPIVMHTSSNKIQYYKFLDANGVDNWLVKDIRPDTTKQEKKENFIAFKTVIEEFTSEKKTADLYSALKGFWERIEALENIEEERWWYSANIDSVKTIVKYSVKGTPRESTIESSHISNVQIITNLLKDSWMALRATLNRENLYAENIGSNDKGFSASSICSNLGKLFEFFKLHQNMEFNMFYKYLFCIRNAASHYRDYNQFTLNDALIYFDCWLTALEIEEKTFGEAFKTQSGKEYMIQGKDGATENTYDYRLLYVYVQYHNSHYIKPESFSKNMVRKKIDWLVSNAKQNILYSEISSDSDLQGRVATFKISSTIPFTAKDKTSKVYLSNA